jgi:GH25 family lysozyme M1 (1,4-beta-N-acetylmuramidase)
MDPPTVAEPEEPTVPLPRGIDVASYQGYPNWESVAAAGYDFAITKVTEDDGYVNPTFAYNWNRIKAAGMIRGAYHFARPQGNDAVTEADYFVDLVEQQGIETGDILALDLEAGAGDLGPWVLAFCRRVEERCGFPPIIYTGRWFSEPHNLGAYPEIGNYALWLASYQQQMPSPPAPWQAVSIWQHSSSGQVPGIAGDVDLNVFNGDLSRLALLGKPASEQPADEFQYLFGFADLAARLGRGVVGDPLENEHAAERNGHPINHQLTTHGEMVYWSQHNRAEFYAAA